MSQTAQKFREHIAGICEQLTELTGLVDAILDDDGPPEAAHAACDADDCPVSECCPADCPLAPGVLADGYVAVNDAHPERGPVKVVRAGREVYVYADGRLHQFRCDSDDNASALFAVLEDVLEHLAA